MKAILIRALSLIMILSASPLANEGQFDIEVYVEDFDDEVEVYGLFSTSENEFGGIELVFYKDVYSYSIRAIESVSDLVANPSARSLETKDKNVLQIVRVFLKPTIIRNNQVRLSGNVITMVNTSQNGEPLFRLVEKPLELAMADNDEEPLVVDPGQPGRKVNLALVLRVKGNSDKVVESSEIRFKASYSLFNNDDDRFDVKDELCQLTYTGGPGDESGLCRHSQMFNLKNGDSLLYIVDYDIDGVKQLTDGSIIFTIAVKRFFFENPTSFFSKAANDRAKGNENYGAKERDIDCTVSINGKERRVQAKIESGRVTQFAWDNIRLLPRDIVQNWESIVGLLKTIETTGDYAYLRPVLNESDGVTAAGVLKGFPANPDNYTGEKVTTTTYSKSITITRWETAEIEIPFTKSHRLPFDGYEIIRLEKLQPHPSDRK